jgi:hypothetical protein
VCDLNVKIDQLKTRKEALQEDSGEAQLTAEDIEQARADLEGVLTDGENGEPNLRLRQ